jgi:hypothetical protein
MTPLKTDILDELRCILSRPERIPRHLGVQTWTSGSTELGTPSQNLDLELCIVCGRRMATPPLRPADRTCSMPP